MLKKFHEIVKGVVALTVILSALFIGYSLYAEGWHGTLVNLKDMWWVFLAIPGVSFALVLLAEAKQAAARFGGKQTERMIESRRASKDRTSGTSQRLYQNRLAQPDYTPQEAARLLTQAPAALQDVLARSASQVIDIPLYLYEMGLPEEHLFRKVTGDVFALVRAQPDGLHFHRCELSTYKDGKKIGPELACLPYSAIRSIQITDNDADRIAQRIAHKLTDKAVNSVTKKISGVKMDPSNVRGATITIRYLMPDGLLFDATFKVPCGSRVTEKTKNSLEKFQDFREGVGKVDGWAKLFSGVSFVDEVGLIHVANETFEYVEMLTTLVSLFEKSDAAVETALHSGQLFSAFTQNEGFQLLFRRDSELPTSKEAQLQPDMATITPEHI